MHFERPSSPQVLAGLRAMRTLIDSKGTPDPAEETFLETVQRVWGTTHDLTRLRPIPPEELAREIPEGPLGRQLVTGLVALSLLDGEAQPAEVACITAFAAALGVPDTARKTLTQLADGHLRRMRFDLIRRSWVAKKIREEVLVDRGIWGALKTALAVAGKVGDPEMLARCEALEGYPAGSLGRAYHDYMKANGFALPGTRGAPPDIMLVHDCAHLLSGYGTDVAGEVQVVGFLIGFAKQDPLDHLLSVMMQFHLGVQITPGAQPTKNRFEIEPFLRAVQRGAAMNVDLNDRWDPWAVFHEPLEELRRRYGVPPLDTGVRGTAPPAERTGSAPP